MLARRGVNIEELETEVSSAAMSGDSTFRARARLRLPDATNVDDIRIGLEAMADNLMVDLELDEQIHHAPRRASLTAAGAGGVSFARAVAIHLVAVRARLVELLGDLVHRVDVS